MLKNTELLFTCTQLESKDFGRGIHLNVIGVTQEDSRTNSMPCSSIRAFLMCSLTRTSVLRLPLYSHNFPGSGTLHFSQASSGTHRLIASSLFCVAGTVQQAEH
eukprot:1140098-Pelagomonas_calceolata.AAC.5